VRSGVAALLQQTLCPRPARILLFLFFYRAFQVLELVVYVCNKVNSNKGAEACISILQFYLQ